MPEYMQIKIIIIITMLSFLSLSNKTIDKSNAELTVSDG